MPCCFKLLFFFFFNDTATTEIYTLSLHDALPIFSCLFGGHRGTPPPGRLPAAGEAHAVPRDPRVESPRERRSEEHTSELQSQSNLVCRLLLEKKKKTRRRRSAGSPEKARERRDTV